LGPKPFDPLSFQKSPYSPAATFKDGQADYSFSVRGFVCCPNKARLIYVSSRTSTYFAISSDVARNSRSRLVSADQSAK